MGQKKSFEDYVCGVSLVEVRSDKTQTLKGLLSNPHDFSSQRKTLMVFLCKSFKRYRGIIRTDCDYRKQSIPSGVGTPPLFNGEKSEFLLGRDAVPNPHVTFERSAKH